MAPKASGILLLIIEKQHAPWELMFTALSALELRFGHRLRVASARPLVDAKCRWTRVVVCMSVELTNGLPVACIPPSGPQQCATQLLDACLMVLRAA